jgi:hypothetical protein
MALRLCGKRAIRFRRQAINQIGWKELSTAAFFWDGKNFNRFPSQNET